MGNYTGYRRDFPPGVVPVKKKLTLHPDEAAILVAQSRERKVSESVVAGEALLNPARSMSSSDAIMLAIELRAVKEEMARFRLPRRENPGDRDEFDQFIASRIRYIDHLVEDLGKL